MLRLNTHELLLMSHRVWTHDPLRYDVLISRAAEKAIASVGQEGMGSAARAKANMAKSF